MLELKGIDLRHREHRTKMVKAIDACLVQLGMPTTGDERFYDESFTAPCTDPEVGKYIESLGINRICDYQGWTPEELRGASEAPIDEVALEILKTKVPEHLVSCRKCLVLAYDFVWFVDDSMWSVLNVATVSLSRIPRLFWEDMTQEEAQAEQERCIRCAYMKIANIEFKLTRERFELELYKIPCVTPRLWRRIEHYGVLKLCRLLCLSDFQLRREDTQMRLPLEKRGALLHELSEHMKICQRCSKAYAFELEREAELQKIAESI
jgi:hypothetical protein